jgi:hypothetical protein
MTGYDSSPDYGGPEPTDWGVFAWTVAMLAVVAWIVLG